MGRFLPSGRSASSLEAFSDISAPELDKTGKRLVDRPAPFMRSKKPRATEHPDHIRSTVLSVRTSHSYGELYENLLRARKQVFIDAKSWDLPEADGMEFDQYDTPQSRSIVLHQYGEILAGVRILPTLARCGCYSYMLRDAQLGVINTIPQHVLYEDAPTADFVWEATRLFVSPEVPARLRMRVQSRLMLEMAKAVVDEGGTHVIGIVPYVFKRWLERIGMAALPIGPKLVMDGDTSQAAMMHVAAFHAALPDSSTRH